MKLSSRGGRWAPEDDEILRKLVLASPFDIAVQLERSLSSVRAGAHRLGIPLDFLLKPSSGL
jgi:hypothetical protein